MEFLIEAATNSLPPVDYQTAVVKSWKEKLELLKKSRTTCDLLTLSNLLNGGMPLEDLVKQVDIEITLISLMAQWKPWEK